MPSHEHKYCPRCQKLIECKVGSILQCACSAIQLNSEERLFIQLQYSDCLCNACLQEVKNEFHQQNFNELLKRLGLDQKP